MRLMFGLITQKRSTLKQIYSSKGQSNLLRGWKWGVVLCSSNIFEDITKTFERPTWISNIRLALIYSKYLYYEKPADMKIQIKKC